MRPTVSQYAQALEELSQGSEANTQEIARNFLGFLKRRGESGWATAIVKRLEKRGSEQSGTLTVTVVTAHELSWETKSLLLEKAGAIFPGKTITLSYEIDSAVIGGARFRTDEMLYDATVASELAALKKTLSK